MIIFIIIMEKTEKKLENYFEMFEFDLNMAVDSSEDISLVDVKVTVPRRNHEEFAYKFEITTALVRVYSCPCRDNNDTIFTFDESRWHSIKMDKFWQKPE